MTYTGPREGTTGQTTQLTAAWADLAPATNALDQTRKDTR